MVDPTNVHPLYSDKVYGVFELKNIKNADKEECQELYQTMERQYEVSDSLDLFCQNFTGNLQNYENINFSNFFNNFRCTFLNIWIYEYLVKEKLNLNDLKSAFIKGRIVKFWNEYDFKNTCDYDFIYYSNKVDYDRMKKMYEFALNFEKLYFFIKTSNDPCTSEDAQYIQDSFKLYKEVESECQPELEIVSEYNTKRIHCDALTDIYNFYGKSKLSELTCTTTMSAEEVLKKIKERESRELGNVVFREIESEDSRLDSFEKHLSPFEEASSPSDSHNAMAITFPLLGVLSIFYSLYKFTPVGSLINSRFTRSKINNFNINEDEHELLENEFDYEHMNVSVGEHGIGYHPVQ
ncbi:Plasmodium vivax Vir protein, putative [Plasmodium ovale]|uniref:Plasmodium vivax Vir protein, putative n=1 Tax=Plasmodium ovale TaxID=36330 RepID=A0A1C3KHB4_PLAOA|nr:Plasmodium vivax Vir protein, putative [Plasmodium ovale]